MSWEYKVVQLDKGRLYKTQETAQEEQLNAVGKEGWELNCVSDGHAYFERMKFEENDGIELEERCCCGCDERCLPDLVECAC